MGKIKNQIFERKNRFKYYSRVLRRELTFNITDKDIEEIKHTLKTIDKSRKSKEIDSEAMTAEYNADLANY